MVPLQMGRERVQDSPRVVVLRIAGDVDYLTVEAVEKHFSDLLEAEQPRHVLLDVSGLTFIVTPFLGSLLFWKQKLAERDGRLVLFGVRPAIEYPMRAMRLHRVLTFCPDRETALAQLPAE
jgi:stage II sporulation protein AA (anti-sigma F factor antagonist)